MNGRTLRYPQMRWCSSISKVGTLFYCKFQIAVASRILEVERTVWFQCKVSASTSFSEAFSYLPKPTRLSLEVKVLRNGDIDWCLIASQLTITHFTLVFSPQPYKWPRVYGCRRASFTTPGAARLLEKQTRSTQTLLQKDGTLNFNCSWSYGILKFTLLFGQIQAKPSTSHHLWNPECPTIHILVFMVY